jgi:hypothetical protein
MISQRAAAHHQEHVMESATLYRVCEPELDMNRSILEAAASAWQRMVATVAALAPSAPMVARPRRSIDRETQEYPFAVE